MLRKHLPAFEHHSHTALGDCAAPEPSRSGRRPTREWETAPSSVYPIQTYFNIQYNKYILWDIDGEPDQIHWREFIPPLSLLRFVVTIRAEGLGLPETHPDCSRGVTSFPMRA